MASDKAEREAKRYPFPDPAIWAPAGERFPEIMEHLHRTKAVCVLLGVWVDRAEKNRVEGETHAGNILIGLYRDHPPLHREYRLLRSVWNVTQSKAALVDSLDHQFAREMVDALAVARFEFQLKKE